MRTRCLVASLSCTRGPSGAALAMALAIWALPSDSREQEAGGSIQLPTTEVVGVAPVAGSGIDPDKIPANVPQPLGPQDFDHSKAPDLLQAMTRSFPFTSLTNQSGNQFQQDFNYRGFVASPVPGTPQGIAVYQNGFF
jgi:iron complex outermembrane recepter protein